MKPTIAALALAAVAGCASTTSSTTAPVSATAKPVITQTIPTPPAPVTTATTHRATPKPSRAVTPTRKATHRAAPPPPPPSTHQPLIVHAGAYCSEPGATGITSTGRAEVCRTSATDNRLRWRRP